MVKTIDEALERYKAELREYKKWIDKTIIKYGPSNPHPMGWSEEDYSRVTTWNSDLVAMKKVLGLNKQEATKINLEVGIVD